MDEAFIIMQIGNPEMDRICDHVIVPAVQAAGLTPRRVDRDNEGDLLKAEIISFLERSQIIVADLTNDARTATSKWATRWASERSRI